MTETTSKPSIFAAPYMPDEEWLEKALPEEAIDPDLPIVDPHMHFWELPGGYRYFIEEFARDVERSGHNVEATVFVECNAMYRNHGPDHLRCIGETEFAVGMAAMAASGKYTSTRAAAGIVGYADLSRGTAAAEVLDAQIEAANGRLKGIRLRAKWDADPAVGGGAFSAGGAQLYLRPEVSEGLKLLTERGLLFEASIFHTQLSDVAALARSNPDCPIVVNHTGSPIGHSSYSTKRDEVLANWLSDIRDLATCPNVSFKLGGLLMCLGNFDFTKAARPPTSEELAMLWRPYLDPCLEILGPDRCMMSSNFPAEKAGVPFGTVWNMFKRITSGGSKDEKSKLFSETAKRIYRLDYES